MSTNDDVVILSRRRRIPAFVLSAAFLWMFASAAFCQQRSIVIKVVNGKTGKPIASTHLVLFGGKTQQDAANKAVNIDDTTTGADGTVTYKIDFDSVRWVQIFVDWHTTCFDDPNAHAFSMEKAVQAGESTPNNCSRLTVMNTPGTFIVFAREPTLREKMAW